MNEIEKLLRKISRADRERLLTVIDLLTTNNIKALDVKKITNTDFYRVRSGRFKIIFHRDSEINDIVVDSVRLRNEKTYRDI